VKGALPPVIVTVALPLFPPLQSTFTDALMDAVPPAARPTFTVEVAVQPLASVTTTV
jgi:hypothetical protein